MQPEKIQMIKSIFNNLSPEQKTESYFAKNHQKFKLANPKLARAIYNEYIQPNRC